MFARRAALRSASFVAGLARMRPVTSLLRRTTFSEAAPFPHDLSVASGAASPLPNEAPPVLKPQFDYRAIRAQAPAYAASMTARGYSSVNIDDIAHRIDARATLLSDLQALRTRRNEIASAMKVIASKPKGARKPAADAASSAADASAEAEQDMPSLIAEGRDLKTKISALEATLSEIEPQLEALAFKLPNMLHPASPAGGEENAKTLAHPNSDRGCLASLTSVGPVEPSPPAVGTVSAPEPFVPLDHLELARRHGWIDLEAASKATGSRFYYLCREAALLEMALIQYTMQRLVARGYTPVLPPDLARTAVVEGAGFQARDERSLAHHIYQVTGTDMSLAATSEISMAGRFMNEVLPEASLPLRYAAFSHCFRTEIGGMGLGTRGIYRVHQFSKVEMFALSTPEQSDALHEELIGIEQSLFEDLGLNFRALEMPHMDLGAPAFRKVDMEACMPGRALTLARAATADVMVAEAAAAAAAAPKPAGGKKQSAAAAAASAVPIASELAPTLFRSLETIAAADVPEHYGEISSTSNCTDYQARRLNIRYRRADADAPEGSVPAPDSDAAAATAAAIGPAAAAAAEAMRVGAAGGTTRFVHTLNGTACAVPRMIIAIMEQFQRPDGTVAIPSALRPFMLGHSQMPFPDVKWS